jgi:hypothetical protein
MIADLVLATLATDALEVTYRLSGATGLWSRPP